MYYCTDYFVRTCLNDGFDCILISMTTNNVLEKFKAPENISVTSYDPQIMNAIIRDVATTSLSIERIADQYGVASSTVYWWRAASPVLLAAWRTAMEARTHVLADTLQADIEAMEAGSEDAFTDPRTATVNIKRFDVKWKHSEWLMGKMNRKDYGDAIEIDNNVTVNGPEAREQAWQNARNVSEAEYTDCSPSLLVNRAGNPTP